MGWGDKFPTIQQLNALTKSPENRSATRAAFKQLFPHESDYKLGELCRQWMSPHTVSLDGEHYAAAPPWNRVPENPDADHPWDEEQANLWAQHCQQDLGSGDVCEVDIDGMTRQGTGDVRETLEKWIVEAIEKDVRIIYRFKRKRNWEKGKWAARRRILDGGTWKILVKGPGF